MNGSLKDQEKRLEWLRDRPELWKDVKLESLPGGNYRWFISQEDQRRLFAIMRDAGLYSAATYWRDPRINKLVRKLKGLR